jgi:hypothetical protein
VITRMVEQRIGEYLGPVDWSYDFDQHAWSATRGGMNPATLASSLDMFRKLADAPGSYVATTDGGWPKVGFHRVLRVGMYDGWPHWTPTPSFCADGPLGPEWHPFYSLAEIRPITRGDMT